MSKNSNFRPIIPYDDLSIENYDISSILNQSKKFEENIDKQIQFLKNQGIDIFTCPFYLESIIEEYISTLYGRLERKHKENMNLIDKIIEKRISNKKVYQNLIEEFEIEIESVKEDYKFLKNLYDTHSPLSKGKLNINPYEAKNE